MARKQQSNRLSDQHKDSQGVAGIFGENAKIHDLKVSEVAKHAVNSLESEYKQLTFRFRDRISKSEINQALQDIDKDLGQTLYVQNASIKPDGGVIEVKDDYGKWRIILVSEAKHQGKDIDNIKIGKLVGANNDQDLMAAGNAIERSHKNISEIANLMLSEIHFPYLLFLEGSNFLTETISIKRPDGRSVNLDYNSGMLNRLDRLTSANHGLPINTNLCKNRFITHKEHTIMLQSASIYTQGDGGRWNPNSMLEIMIEIAKSSLNTLGRDIFKQLTQGA